MSSDSAMLGTNESYAVVIALARAHHSGGTSCPYCAKLSGSLDNELQLNTKENPFKLLNKSGLYLWENIPLRTSGIEVGSLIIVDCSGKFVENTGMKMVSVHLFSRGKLRV